MFEVEKAYHSDFRGGNFSTGELFLHKNSGLIELIRKMGERNQSGISPTTAGPLIEPHIKTIL
jgi:hypothetical protein